MCYSWPRLGDQIRFKENGSVDKMIVSYVLDLDMLESDFGAANYIGFQELKRIVDLHLGEAEEIHVTCKAGTDFSGSGTGWNRSNTDTTVKRFPISVFAPVPAAGFSGRIAQIGFLVGTGSTYYQTYAREIEDVLFVSFKDNRIIGFEGSDADVKNRGNSLCSYRSRAWHRHQFCSFLACRHTPWM